MRNYRIGKRVSAHLDALDNLPSFRFYRPRSRRYEGYLDVHTRPEDDGPEPPDDLATPFELPTTEEEEN